MTTSMVGQSSFGRIPGLDFVTSMAGAGVLASTSDGGSKDNPIVVPTQTATSASAESTKQTKPVKMPDSQWTAIKNDFLIKVVSDASNGIQTFQQAYLKYYKDGQHWLYNEDNLIARTLLPFIADVRANPTSPENRDFLVSLGSSSKLLAGALTLYRYSKMIRTLSGDLYKAPEDLADWRKRTFFASRGGEVLRSASMMADTVLFFGGLGLLWSGHTDIAFWSYLGANTFRWATAASLVATKPFLYIDAKREDADRIKADPTAKPKNLNITNLAVELTVSGVAQVGMQSVVLYYIAQHWNEDAGSLIAAMESSSVTIPATLSLGFGLLQFFGPLNSIRTSYGQFSNHTGEARKADAYSLVGASAQGIASMLYSWPELRFAAHMISAIAQLFRFRSMQIQTKISYSK